MTGNIRVLIIVKSIDGGPGTFLQHLAKINTTQNGKNIVIRIIALEKPSYREDNIPNIIFMRGKKYYPQSYSLSIFNFAKLLEELVFIRAVMKKLQPDIVMGIDLRCNLIAISSKFLINTKVKVIAASHIDLASLTLKISNGLVKNLLRKTINLFYERADALVSVSQTLAYGLRSDFNIRKNIKTIYNGVELGPNKIKNYPKNKKLTLVSIGRLNSQKDYGTLITAVGLLNQNFPNFELLIGGDGPEMKILKSLSNKLRVKRKIKFLGWIKNPANLLKKAHIFILSSKFEGLPYTLLEAMSFGLPIVTTNAPYGPAEILEGSKNGLLVPVGDPKRMSEAILKLATKKAQYDYFSKRSIIRSKDFSRTKMFNSYTVLFRSLVKK